MVVGTLGHLLTLEVTPANEQERAQVGELMAETRVVTDGSVELAFVDEGYTGDDPTMASAEQGVVLEVVKLPEAKRGFVLLPRRWVVEPSFAWLIRFRRLVRDFKRLPETAARLHFLAFACLRSRKPSNSARVNNSFQAPAAPVVQALARRPRDALLATYTVGPE
jgi:transposase